MGRSGGLLCLSLTICKMETPALRPEVWRAWRASTDTRQRLSLVGSPLRGAHPVSKALWGQPAARGHLPGLSLQRKRPLGSNRSPALAAEAPPHEHRALCRCPLVCDTRLQTPVRTETGAGAGHEAARCLLPALPGLEEALEPRSPSVSAVKRGRSLGGLQTEDRMRFQVDGTGHRRDPSRGHSCYLFLF